MEIGDRLRAVREQLGYSQREAAELADMRYQYLSDLERGRVENPSLDTLARLADAYEMGVSDLIGHYVSRDPETLPDGLRELLDDPQWSDEITDAWIETLLQIAFQGRGLETKREFLLAYLMLQQLLDE